MEARFENPAAVAGNEAGNAGDDADLVRAGGGERVENGRYAWLLVVSH
jgi:hypothetical protein